MLDLMIIGSGPAGLTAAIYAMRAGLQTLVIEKSPMSGGQMATTYEVDNYPGLPGIDGMELGMKMRAHAEKLGAEFLTDEVIAVNLQERIKQVQTERETFCAKAVVIATGASHAHLDIPGEKELTGMGVSYCATCDGAFFRNKTVAVIGGGDVAAEDALYLSAICKKVYLIHRRDRLRAAYLLQKRVKETEQIEILWDTVAEKVCGQEHVNSLQIRNVKSGQGRELDLQGVFIAIGIRPETTLFQGEVELDNAGYVIADEDGRTNLSGVYVAGDARKKKLRQIVTAVSDGANVIASVQEDMSAGVLG